MTFVNSESAEPPTWEHARAVVLHRDRYLCQICRTAVATEVDHIWPRSEGGPDLLENLQAACSPCNKAKGSRVDMGAATFRQIQWARDYWQRRVAVEGAELDAYDETMSSLRDWMENDHSVTVAAAVDLIAKAAA